MGKLNFRGYLISRFYPTREIRADAREKCVLQYSFHYTVKHMHDIMHN